MNVTDSACSYLAPSQSGHPLEEVEFTGAGGTRYTTSVVTDPEDLAEIDEAWSDLASRSADPNPFYEPWFFLPASRHLVSNERWQILLVHGHSKKATAPSRLVGFFPFVARRGPGGIRQLALWKHQFCFLTNPLIDQEHGPDVLRTLFQYVRGRERTFGCLQLPLLAGDGLLHQGVTEVLREELATTYVADEYLRATTHCSGNAEDYLKEALGGHHFREYRRMRRKLAAQGQLEYRELQDARALAGWLEWFLTLEAQGWKARAGTAMQLNADETRFFKEMAAEAQKRGRLDMAGLFFNGEPIAMRCTLLSPPGAFAFKIAFDETYRRYSPGVQLEFESLQRLSDKSEIHWCDSCAVPGHQMIDRLWMERRVIRSLLISTGRSYSDVVIGALPLFRSLNRVRKRWSEQIRQVCARSLQTPVRS